MCLLRNARLLQPLVAVPSVATPAPRMCAAISGSAARRFVLRCARDADCSPICFDLRAATECPVSGFQHLCQTGLFMPRQKSGRKRRLASAVGSRASRRFGREAAGQMLMHRDVIEFAQAILDRLQAFEEYLLSADGFSTRENVGKELGRVADFLDADAQLVPTAGIKVAQLAPALEYLLPAPIELVVAKRSIGVSRSSCRMGSSMFNHSPTSVQAARSINNMRNRADSTAARARRNARWRRCASSSSSAGNPVQIGIRNQFLRFLGGRIGTCPQHIHLARGSKLRGDPF